MQALMIECLAIVAFVAASVAGFKVSLWFVVAALAAHGMFDSVHGELIANPGVPAWWPAFCLAYDVTAAAYLAWKNTVRREGIAARCDRRVLVEKIVDRPEQLQLVVAVSRLEVEGTGPREVDAAIRRCCR
jgi:hypothetical protein